MWLLKIKALWLALNDPVINFEFHATMSYLWFYFLVIVIVSLFCLALIGLYYALYGGRCNE